MSPISPLIQVMQQAARKAARDLNRDFNELENLQVSRKGPGDFVSVADIRTEQILIENLQKARPEFGFLTEEGQAGKPTQEGRRWIIDPIDGTTNFLHGLPHFAISIGLEDNGRLLAGLIYQPVTDEMFWAERGGGAYLNNRRLRVSNRRNMDECLVATGIPHLGREGADGFQRELSLIAPKVSGVRRFGAASLDLAYVASGRYEMFWERNLAPWDIAAGVLLVREAGGYVTTPEGGEKILESGDILAANAEMHEPFRRLFQTIPKN